MNVLLGHFDFVPLIYGVLMFGKRAIDDALDGASSGSVKLVVSSGGRLSETPAIAFPQVNDDSDYPFRSIRHPKEILR